jgi:hypothetical protein
MQRYEINFHVYSRQNNRIGNRFSINIIGDTFEAELFFNCLLPIAIGCNMNIYARECCLLSRGEAFIQPALATSDLIDGYSRC